MNLKRIAAGILTFSLLTTGLSACNDKKKVIDKSEDVITINWWTFPVISQEGDNPQGTFENALIEAFEDKYKNIKVNVEYIDFTKGPEKINLAIKNGTVCDVLLDAPGRIIQYGKSGQLVTLNDMFEDGLEEDIVNTEILNACKSGEDAYMYPLSAAPFYMAFNKEYLEKSGVIDLVKEGWDTEDFTTVITALKENGYVPGSLFCSGTGGDQGTRAFISNLYSSKITDLSQYTINDEAGIKGFEYVKNAVENKTLLNGIMYNGGEDISRFVNGQSSYTLLWGPSQQKSNQKLLKLNNVETVEVPYPSDDGVAELEYLVNGFGIFDNGNEAKIEAAKEFVKFACDDGEWGKKAVTLTGCFPVRKSFGELYEDERMKKIALWSEYYGTYYNTVNGFNSMRIYWYTALQKLLANDRDTKAIADEFVKASNETLKQSS